MLRLLPSVITSNMRKQRLRSLKFFNACSAGGIPTVPAQDEAKGVDIKMTRFRWLTLLSVVIIATALCSWGQFAISVSFGPLAPACLCPTDLSGPGLHLGAWVLGVEP